VIDQEFAAWVDGERSLLDRLENGIGQFLAFVVVTLIVISPLIIAGILDWIARRATEPV